MWGGGCGPTLAAAEMHKLHDTSLPHTACPAEPPAPPSFTGRRYKDDPTIMAWWVQGPAGQAKAQALCELQPVLAHQEGTAGLLRLLLVMLPQLAPTNSIYHV